MASKLKGKVPSIFEAAQLAGSISAEISIRDVKTFRPHWTDAQAKAFLDRHVDAIGQIMLVSALQTMQQLLERGDDIVQ